MDETKFSDWFVAQFGKRPVGANMDMELDAAIVEGAEAQRLKDLCRTYDDRLYAARLAWLANEHIANQLGV
jgi:hypothetical protein